ncbi:STAS domain-containing protein [Litoribrevibacter albus]|uniref:Anti-anti-sigma factor n=1 Tax=Litoribrevibacter albus TaxID=1473156 RepID=A0AA37W4G4_9GAMM|nr:STAS domain-containing protein [Litoribrevibacter albus]GLQ30072.1 anti-anti-sigma factor [Litoribrevibacter albus]
MENGRILVSEKDGTYILKFIGDVRLTLCATLDEFLESMCQSDQLKAVLIDLTETDGIDSTSLGLLAKISVLSRKKHHLIPTIISTNNDITRILESMGFHQVFVILNKPLTTPINLSELPVIEGSEEVVHRKVLEAHKILMAMNESNKETFKDLVYTLEGDGKHG